MIFISNKKNIEDLSKWIQEHPTVEKQAIKEKRFTIDEALDVKLFPINVFEDIKPIAFQKHNKKHVSEDFVAENFKRVGWDIYRPFVDTGIDLIASRLICLDNHIKWNQIIDPNKNICPNCGKKLFRIIRFIQVKTREIKGEIFGYTLTSKDFRTDPRHVFILYSDHSMDFIIIPIYEYLKIFYDNIDTMGKTHFMIPSFRQNNNKLNSLRLDNSGWFWRSKGNKKISFNRFVNEKGMELISNPKYDIEFDCIIKEIAMKKILLFYSFSKGRQTNDSTEKKINKTLKENKGLTAVDFIKSRNEVKNKLKNKLNPELIKSINEGYLVKFKGVEF